jgi:hypothetical protein
LTKELRINPCLYALLIVCGFIFSSCAEQTPIQQTRTRNDAIPAEAVKMAPEKDIWPPVPAHGWSQPVPLDGPINTAGGEDSPFITPDGNTLYFVFIPDVNTSPEKQVVDGFSGVWQTTRSRGQWREPQRILLSETDELHLDGCPFVMDDWMAFCSIRAGNYREIDIYTAEFQNGIWTNVQNWGKLMNQQYQVGELHIANDGNLYFASDRTGGMGGFDLWVSIWNGQTWEKPINLGSAINTSNNENRPFITADGQELWFDGASQKGYPGPAIFRSLRQPDGTWGPAEEIISSFAGEPTLTGDENTLFFAHAYFPTDLSQMIEIDIYVSHRLDIDG